VFSRNELPQEDAQPTITGLDEERAVQFLLEHLKNANWQQKGKIQDKAPDFRVGSNQEFWERLLQERNVALIRWVELRQFQIVDWFPRTPGLYHTNYAAHARQEAQEYVTEENGIQFYTPEGKFNMLTGGIGSIRFKPIFIGQEEYWLCTATSDGYVHSGIPLAIPTQIMRNLDFSDYRFWFNIFGQVKFLPKFLEEHFYHMNRIPQIYVQVDNISTFIKDNSTTPVKITPMVFFKGESIRRKESWREQIGSVTYVTCRADSLNELNRASDWLQWYADKYHGEIITNFDEQRLVFKDAPFSLQNVMSGRLDKYQVQDLNIEHAEIICNIQYLRQK
jgi:hypothetical protein